MPQPDVVIVGGGLAGLTLARQLLLETNRFILMLERRDQLPPERQKVGESTVQLAGHYLAKVLDLEPYLLHHHFMKYNLRFYWPAGASEGTRFEDYGHVAIRPFSNVPSYQVNRNTLEAELLRLNQTSPRFELLTSVRTLEVELEEEGPHTVRFTAGEGEHTVRTPWVVDASGRGRFLARRLGLRTEMPIRHGSVFWWVEGTVDIERLTDRSRKEVRLRPERRDIGHLPAFLATNHFMDEGLWFWVIPLQGKTSLGLVFDSAVVDHANVATAEKATDWVCDRFPLFARDLRERKVLDAAGFKSFAHDCERTISAQGWAMTGEAGRFTDPLYSPGSDLISIHNTLITAAVAADEEDRASTCELYEQIMRAVAHAYVPSYGTSYDALGDQECFALKYGWELAVYFVAYVFPFLNDLFSDRRFLLAFLRFFSTLGPINQGLHGLISELFQWKRERGVPRPAEPIYFDLMDFPALRRAETCFYRVGVDVDEAREVLREQLVHLEELARFIVAHVVSVVEQDPRVLRSAAFVDGIDLRTGDFGLETQRRRWRDLDDPGGAREWEIDLEVMDRFRTQPPSESMEKAG